MIDIVHKYKEFLKFVLFRLLNIFDLILLKFLCHSNHKMEIFCDEKYDNSAKWKGKLKPFN